MAEPGATAQLAAYSLSDAGQLPPAVVAQARRAFLNYVGCALAGAGEPASIKAAHHADEFSGVRKATVIGRQLRLDAQHAALVNCLQSSIQTFDDTHLASVVHPTGPAAAALMALIDHRAMRVDGGAFLAALAMGIELSCRIGAVLTAPSAGMHLGIFTTGVACGVGAAAACGRLLGLDAQRQAWAMGIAAAQAGGLRVSHATMTGGLVPAIAARTGLAAALLAADGFDSSEAALEGRNGLLAVLAPGADTSALVEGLGQRFEMAELAYKPYPCGIVIHPAIDACLELARRAEGERLERLRLHVNPLALQLTGTRHPANALSCNTSLFHWAAAAWLRSRAGLAEASDEAVGDPSIAALRGTIDAVPDPALPRDAAVAEAVLAGGRVLTCEIGHARGSRDRPLTDGELAAKFTALATPVLGGGRANRLLALCDALPAAPPGALAEIASFCIPPGESHV